MKKNWRRWCLLIFIGWCVAANSIFYGYNLLPVLEIGYVLLAIGMTSALEFLLFYPGIFRRKAFRRFQALAYLGASFFKLAEMIFFKQYGNYDLFSRADQAMYLSDLGEYIIGQLTPPILWFVLISLLGFGFLLYFVEDGIPDRRLEGKKRSWAFAAGFGLYLLLSLWIGATGYIEVYHALGRSAYRAFFSNEILSASEHREEIAPQEREKLLLRNYLHENEYTGIGADKNLLIIQVESLQDNFIGRSYNGKEITPFLNRFKEKAFYFSDYFELLGFGNSSDAEYVSLHSTFSNTGQGAYVEYKSADVMGLPKIARSKGYQTFAMHGNTGEFYGREVAHVGIGFEQVYMGESYEQDEKIGMGLSDRSFFRQSLPRIEEAYQAGKFLGFMITLTCHGPFDIPEAEQRFAIGKEVENTTFGRYLNAVAYTDKALGELIEGLEQRGILKDTVIALYGDHHAFANVDPESSQSMEEFLGRPFDFDEMLRVPLMIYVPGYEKAVLRENIGSQIDFLPTIVNLMGWNDIASPMFGIDLLDSELSKDNIVFPQTYMLKGSYITDEEMFERSRIQEGAVGRLINRKSRELLPMERAKALYEEANRRIDEAQQLYQGDRIKELLRRWEGYK